MKELPEEHVPTTSPPFFLFIMAGGSGERFWPASRKNKPKHLLHLLSEETLLAQTLKRFETILPAEQIFILTNEAQWEATTQAIPHHPKENILAEPAKRDTAPAATLATALALRKHPHALVGLFPADAMIHDVALFQKQLLEAISMASSSAALVTFSIKPTHPSISFGYLELGESLPTSDSSSSSFYHVRRFVEKPPLAQAKEYLKSGRYGWNAGMFLWRAETFLAECERQQPLLATFLKELSTTVEASKYIETHFPKLPKISVDYAIMEKAPSVIATQATFDWDDVGHWTALPKHLGADEEGNTIQAAADKVHLHEASGNVIVSKGKPIALCGVHDLVVVQTEDAILICHRDAVENIKHLPLPEELK